MSKERFFVSLGVASFILLVFIFFATSPTDMGPFEILGVFILIYLMLSSLLTLVIFYFSKMKLKVSKNIITKTPKVMISLRKSYYFASVLALFPVMLVGMQSLGSLGIQEFLLILTFTALATFYVSRRF